MRGQVIDDVAGPISSFGDQALEVRFFFRGFSWCTGEGGGLANEAKECQSRSGDRAGDKPRQMLMVV